jgi:hypothetical protein
MANVRSNKKRPKRVNPLTPESSCDDEGEDPNIPAFKLKNSSAENDIFNLKISNDSQFAITENNMRVEVMQDDQEKQHLT